LAGVHPKNMDAIIEQPRSMVSALLNKTSINTVVLDRITKEKTWPVLSSGKD